MSKFRLLLVQAAMGVFGLLASPGAQARQVCGNVPITQFIIEADGWVYVGIHPLAMTGFTCPGHIDTLFAFNSATATGKAQLSVALAAYLSRRRISMDGDEACHGQVEILRRIFFTT